MEPKVAAKDVNLRLGARVSNRPIEDRIRIRRGKVEVHEVPAHGKIITLHPEADCDRIETPDGRAIYFHRNSIVNADFGQLESGLEVRFSEESCDEGPQATSVQLIGKHHLVD